MNQCCLLDFNLEITGWPLGVGHFIGKLHTELGNDEFVCEVMFCVVADQELKCGLDSCTSKASFFSRTAE